MIQQPVQPDELDEAELHFESPAGALSGSGELARIELPYRLDSLAATMRTLSLQLQEHGPDTIAFASVPFSASKPVLAVIPERIAHHPGTRQSSSSFEPVHNYEVMPGRAPKLWCDAVAEAVRRIRNGDLEKVVLARDVSVVSDDAFPVDGVLDQLRSGYPDSYRFAIDGLVGASPELLVELTGRTVVSRPLAGTIARSGDSATDASLRNSLFGSEKDQNEHRFLADAVTDALRDFCDDVSAPAQPEVLSLPNVHHLATRVSGTLRDANTTALDIVGALHPTPAIGGVPTGKALALIEELEEMDRGRYAGAVGWMNGAGEGCFALAIRCAQIEGNRARLYAGNGIVAGSVPERELEETRWKLQAMLSALVRP